MVQIDSNIPSIPSVPTFDKSYVTFGFRSLWMPICLHTQNFRRFPTHHEVNICCQAGADP